AQIILGTWLGGAFRPTLVASAGRLVAASARTALLFLALCCGTGVGVASLLGWNWQTLVLSTAPGGVTEMALTAKYLGTDVALITA
ncbi:AbrB family transcriptional regulator, partial [Klebsiella pneumoniae]